MVDNPGRTQPITPIKTVAEQHAAPVASIQEHVRRVRDVFEVDQVRVLLGKVADFVVDAPSVPVDINSGWM